VLSDLTASLKHSGQSVLTVGGDFQKASYETYETVNDVDARSLGLFAQEKIVRDRWIWRLGGRANWTDHEYNRVSSARPEVRDRSWDSLLYSAGFRFRITPEFSVFPILVPAS